MTPSEAATYIRELEWALILMQRASWDVMETSEDHVSEEQGMARFAALADLIGYPRPGGPPSRTVPTMVDEKIADVVEETGKTIEAMLPAGWSFTLFLYRSKPGSDIAHIARDVTLSREVVRRWLAWQEAKARGGGTGGRA